MHHERPNDPRQHIQWTREVEEQRGLMTPLVRPAPGRPLNLVALGDAVQGTTLHYVDRQTIPCLGSPERCRPCREWIGRRRMYYLACATMPGWKPVILCMTAGAYRQCPALHGEGANLRGRIIKSWRTGNSPTGPQYVTVDRHCGHELVPPTFDLEAQLLKVWGFDPSCVDGSMDE